MQDVRKRLIHLYLCRGMNRQFLRHLLTEDPNLIEIYSLSTSDLHDLFFLPFHKAEQLQRDLHNDRLQTYIEKQLHSYQIMTIFDHDYPHLFKKINDPPLVLFLAGNRHLLHCNPSLSVIGTRKPSKNAYEKVRFYLQPLLARQWTIVSGLARGIDSYAHQITLLEGGQTIAILGGGFQHIYPPEHSKLFQKIKEKGLVISEYAPYMRARKHHFPERNRLISGISFGTLVVEATKRSGTLITVDQALDQGRQVYVAPGCPLLKQTAGCHQMIQDGAQLVMNAQDLLADWKLVGKNFMSS